MIVFGIFSGLISASAEVVLLLSSLLDSVTVEAIVGRGNLAARGCTLRREACKNINGFRYGWKHLSFEGHMNLINGFMLESYPIAHRVHTRSILVCKAVVALSAWSAW